MKLISKNTLSSLWSFSNKGKRLQSAFSFLLLILLSQSTLHAQTITVISVDGAPVCSGSTVALTFNANNGLTNNYNTSTIYKVYLSDKSGTSYIATGETFSTPGVSYSNVAFGFTTITKTITIPVNTVSGTAYKIALGSTGPTFDASSGTGASVGTFEIKALPSAAGLISGSAGVCQGQSSVAYSVPVVTDATSYTWTYSGTGATITGTTNNVTITFAANATAGNLTVRGINSCGSGTVSANYVIAVNPVSVGGTASDNQTICSGSTQADIMLSGQTGSIQWQSSTDNSAFNNISGATTSTLTAAQMGSLTATAYYRAVVTSGVCTSANSTLVTITVDACAPEDNGAGKLNLGTLTLFAAYSVAGAVTNSGTSTVRCNVGSNEGVITGFQSPTTVGMIHNADAVSAEAKIHMLRVYTHLSDVFVTNTTHAAAFGGGETLTAGVYSIAGAGSLGGQITLDGQGNEDAFFIIKFEGAFTMAAASKIILANGTRSCNVFWIAQGAISAGASCSLKGSLIAYPGAITVPNGNLEGRMLSSAGAINFGPGELIVPAGPITIPIKCDNTCNNNILGTVANFAIFTSAGAVTNAGPSGLVGDIGSDSGAISGFASATIVGSIKNVDAVTAQAKIDLQAAYQALVLIPPTNVVHTAAFGSGETLTAGVYAIAGAGSLAGTLTLDAQGNPDAFFIFRFTGAFATAAKSKVIFTNGVRRCNVFWIAEGAISMGAFTYMKGTLIAHDGANNMGANGNLEGRMLSTAGAIGISTGVLYTNTLCFDNPLNKWTGMIDTAWNVSCNWTQNYIPAVDDNIIFDDVPVNDCFLDQDRSVTDITNAQSIYGMFLKGNKLTLKGNLLFSGGAVIDASMVNSVMQFSGSKVQTIKSTEFKDDAVYKLTIDNAMAVNLATNFTVTDALVINSGKKLSVSSLNQLTALGSITNNAGTTGFVLKSDVNGTASLIHNTNNVPATVQRYISGPTEGWHFLSSPVSGQSFSSSWLPAGTYGNGTGYDLYLWDEPSFSFKYKLDTTPIGWNSVHVGTDFSVGRGYLYSVQATNPTKEFQGNLNNGTVNYPITITETVEPTLVELQGFNLVGNPYPSSVDWQASSGWDRTKLELSGGGNDMWVWNPTSNNYGVFNSTSGVGTNSISRYLAPMQGYFVKAVNGGNLQFDNTVRVHTGAGNWFKNSAIKNGIIRIAVESEDGSGADEALIQFGYSNNKQGASKLFSHVITAPSLYMSSNRMDYSVRYMTNTTENSSVAVAFKAGNDVFYNFKFNFDSKEFGFVLLEDRLLKTTEAVKPSTIYRFKSSKKDDVNRFILHFSEVDSTIENELAAFVYMDGSRLAVDLSALAGQTEIAIFDISGRLLLRKNLDGLEVHMLNVNSATQILLVKLKNEKGELNTKVLYSAKK